MSYQQTSPQHRDELLQLEPWKFWRSPCDALAWASKILPDLTPQELQQLFDSVPTINGKKATAFVEHVLEIAVTF